MSFFSSDLEKQSKDFRCSSTQYNGIPSTVSSSFELWLLIIYFATLFNLKPANYVDFNCEFDKLVKLIVQFWRVFTPGPHAR